MCMYLFKYANYFVWVEHRRHLSSISISKCMYVCMYVCSLRLKTRRLTALCGPSKPYPGVTTTSTKTSCCCPTHGPLPLVHTYIHTVDEYCLCFLLSMFLIYRVCAGSMPERNRAGKKLGGWFGRPAARREESGGGLRRWWSPWPIVSIYVCMCNEQVFECMYVVHHRFNVFVGY